MPLFSSAASRKASETHFIVGLGDKHVYCVVCPAASPHPQVLACRQSVVACPCAIGWQSRFEPIHDRD